jgi:CDP-diacylglycerol--inositol 3-phosphatidyltransferase
MDSSSNPMLKLYYTNRKVLFCMCAGNELFYVSLYLLHFSAGFFYYLTFMLALIMAPVAIVKLGIALIQVSRLDVSKHK